MKKLDLMIELTLLLEKKNDQGCEAFLSLFQDFVDRLEYSVMVEFARKENQEGIKHIPLKKKQKKLLEYSKKI